MKKDGRKKEYRFREKKGGSYQSRQRGRKETLEHVERKKKGLAMGLEGGGLKRHIIGQRKKKKAASGRRERKKRGAYSPIKGGKRHRKKSFSSK